MILELSLKRYREIKRAVVFRMRMPRTTRRSKPIRLFRVRNVGLSRIPGSVRVSTCKITFNLTLDTSCVSFEYLDNPRDFF
jgi:hypothetical protein